MEQKTPEQIAAEQALEAQRKQAEEQAAQEKAAAEKAEAQRIAAEEQAAAEQALEEKKQRAGELHFVLDGEVYVPQVPRLLIPGIGVRTALEICLDEAAQKYLVEKGGSVKKID